MPQRERVNPFYVLLLILGVVFAVTACAYGVMAVKFSTAEGIAAAGESPFLDLLNRRGLMILGVEIALLAVASFAAMATDRYWTVRDSQEPPHDAPG